MTDTETNLLDSTQDERDLLSYLLGRPTAIREAAGIVTPDDFANPRMASVFNLIAGMVSASDIPATIDAADVVRAVKVRREKDQQSWPDQMQMIGMVRDSPSNVWAPAKRILDASLRRRADGLARRVLEEVRAFDEAASIAPRAAAAFAALRDSRPTTGRLVPRPLGDVVDDDSLSQYAWLIAGLLEAGDRLIVTGEEGWGKSVLLRQLCILPGAGIHPFKLTPLPSPARSLVIDCENSERQWHRKVGPLMRGAARLGSDEVRENVQLVCTGRMDITSAADLAEVHRLIDQHDPQILLIGPLYKLVPRAITNDDDAAPLITALDSLRERGVALLMEAHAAHAGQSGQDWRPRGSRALMGWPEFGFGLGRNREKPTMVADVHRWRGDRDERDWPVSLVRGGSLPCWLSEDHSDSRKRLALHDAASQTTWSPTSALEEDR